MRFTFFQCKGEIRHQHIGLVFCVCFHGPRQKTLKRTYRTVCISALQSSGWNCVCVTRHIYGWL